MIMECMHVFILTERLSCGVHGSTFMPLSWTDVNMLYIHSFQTNTYLVQSAVQEIFAELGTTARSS
jgi:hypothetical protein